MPLVLDRPAVLDVFSEAAERRWVMLNLNTENRMCTEAILGAARDCAVRINVPDLPIIVGLTGRYWHRPQLEYYTHTRDWRIGLRMFLADMGILCGQGSPYADLRVLIHLDHMQWDADRELLDGDLRRFSSVMYDASTLPLDENIRRTAEFVRRHARDIMIEGACDEINEATESAKGGLTTPEQAARYTAETGVDLLVANVGTEHRADAANRRYHQDLVRTITGLIGPKLCLHGTSSVPADQVAGLFDDGVRKVNVWTALERDSSPDLLRDMIAHAANIVGSAAATALAREGLLGAKADLAGPASLDYYTTTYRQAIVYEGMKRVARNFMELWYR